LALSYLLKLSSQPKPSTWILGGFGNSGLTAKNSTSGNFGTASRAGVAKEIAEIVFVAQGVEVGAGFCLWPHKIMDIINILRWGSFQFGFARSTALCFEGRKPGLMRGDDLQDFFTFAHPVPP
jgi:hypothetical protein